MSVLKYVFSLTGFCVHFTPPVLSLLVEHAAPHIHDSNNKLANHAQLICTSMEVCILRLSLAICVCVLICTFIYLCVCAYLIL